MMNLWQEKANAYKEDFLKDLFELLKIPSVKDPLTKTIDAPLGKEVKNALDLFLSFGERDGFKTKNIENLAGQISYGKGDKTLGIFGHVDVVPVGDGWNSPPFLPTLENGIITARGIADDKGPMLACYYGLKIIKDMGLPLKNKIHFIIGTDEESDWECMAAYKRHETMPDIAFSPDADFPIINGEKGITDLSLHFKADGKGMWKIKEFHSGTRANMVPDKAKASITGTSLERLSESFSAFLTQNPEIDGHFHMANDTLVLECNGKASHGMQPELGINAGNYLASFLSEYDFGLSARNYFQFIKTYLHKEHDGKSFALDTHHDIMGETTVNTGILHYDDSKAYVTLNIRYPLGLSHEKVLSTIESLISPMGLQSVEVLSVSLPHYVPKEDPLVKTLLQAYENQTGEKGMEKSIGGGTYGKLVPRGVAFGAHFPNRKDTMHQANEEMPLEDLILAIAIYAEGIYALTKDEIMPFGADQC